MIFIPCILGFLTTLGWMLPFRGYVHVLCVCVCVLCTMNSLYFKITPSIFFIQHAMNCTNVGRFLQQSFLPTSNVAFQFREPYSNELKSSFIPAASCIRYMIPVFFPSVSSYGCNLKSVLAKQIYHNINLELESLIIYFS